MSAERLAQAAAIRAGGQQAAQSLKAIADRQAVEIVAAANKDSEILRGQGDAQRSAIFASAYGADPEFFEFYRSLESYRTALGSSGTSMVLSPDSEFFRYFKADTLNGTVPQPAAPNGIAPLPSSEVTAPAPSDQLPPDNVGAPVDSGVVGAPAVPVAPDASASEPSPLPSSEAAPTAVNPDGTIVAPSISSELPSSAAQ
jgi:membrane protease subunit HflC